MKLKVATIVSLLLLSVPAVSLAEDEEGDDWVRAIKSSELEPPRHSLTRRVSANTASADNRPDDKKGIDETNPTELRSHASTALRNCDVDEAIRLVEKAIVLQPEDTDGRQIYADALEQKIKAQTERDPHLFNQCVKQWYFLYKHAEYPEMGNLAAKHLKDLTGKSPVVWPTPKMYLGRVLMAEPGVTGGGTAEISEEPVQIH